MEPKEIKGEETQGAVLSLQDAETLDKLAEILQEKVSKAAADKEEKRLRQLPKSNGYLPADWYKNDQMIGGFGGKTIAELTFKSIDK